MTSALLAFLHHLSAFVVFAALMAELVLVKAQLTTVSARTVLRMDAVYGIAATVLEEARRRTIRMVTIRNWRCLPSSCSAPP